jgi:hypothetical protein
MYDGNIFYTRFAAVYDGQTHTGIQLLRICSFLAALAAGTLSSRNRLWL